MGKRSNFERRDRDFYPTPIEAVKPLTNNICLGDYIEPCAGDMSLVKILNDAGGNCLLSSDIEPRAEDCIEEDVFNITSFCSEVITNPPWDRKILHPLISHLIKYCSQGFWLLFDADWMHTKQSSNLIRYCDTIISIGRVKWIPDSKMTGKDNCCWYHFMSEESQYTIFKGR